jgi:hypothetical protein
VDGLLLVDVRDGIRLLLSGRIGPLLYGLVPAVYGPLHQLRVLCLLRRPLDRDADRLIVGDLSCVLALLLLRPWEPSADGEGELRPRGLQVARHGDGGEGAGEGRGREGDGGG